MHHPLTLYNLIIYNRVLFTVFTKHKHIIYQKKINELSNNKKDKNYIENKINEIKNALKKCLEDDKCYSDVFNDCLFILMVEEGVIPFETKEDKELCDMMCGEVEDD